MIHMNKSQTTFRASLLLPQWDRQCLYDISLHERALFEDKLKQWRVARLLPMLYSELN
jgi:hypothetical protein